MTRSTNLFLVVFFALAAVACSDPCGDLEEQCGNCPGTDSESQAVEMACNIIVDADNDDACDAALDIEQYECP